MNERDVLNSEQKTTADKLAFSASQFGISVFRNAKSVLNASKKTVEKILEKSTMGQDVFTEPDNLWENPKYKDTGYPDTASPTNTKTRAVPLKKDYSYPTVAGTSPYTPSDMLNSSVEGLESTFESSHISKAKLRVEDPIETADLLAIDGHPEEKDSRKNYSSIFENQVEIEPTIRNRSENPSNKSTTFGLRTLPPNKATPVGLPNLALSKERAKGNELFKNGQFGDAEAEYTKAISQISTTNPEFLILLNNRSACRIKIGDNRNAVLDCDQVLNFDPKDIKARLRRATAYEALENWAKAQEDYRFLMGIDPTIKSVSSGLARCTSALTKTESKPNIIPQKKMPNKQVKAAVDNAVQKHRSKNEEMELEESEKFKYHDHVTEKVYSIK